MNRPTQFASGAALGVLLAIVGITVGFIGAIAAVAVVVMVGFAMPRFATLSGGMTAIGVTWLLLVGNSIAICSRTDDFCGKANFIPMLIVSIAIASVGLLLGLWTLVRARRDHGA